MLVQKLYTALSTRTHREFIRWLTYHVTNEERAETLINLAERIYAKEDPQVIKTAYYGAEADHPKQARAFNLLSHELYKDLKLFLAYSRLKKDESRRDWLLLDWLRNTQAVAVFEDFWRSTRDRLRKLTQSRRGEFLHDLYQLEAYAQEHAISNGRDQSQRRLVAPMSRAFDQYWAVEKINLLMAMVTFDRFSLQNQTHNGKSPTPSVFDAEQKQFLDLLHAYAKTHRAFHLSFLLTIIDKAEASTLDITREIKVLRSDQTLSQQLSIPQQTNLFHFLLSYIAHQANVATAEIRAQTLTHVKELYDWASDSKIVFQGGNDDVMYYNHYLSVLIGLREIDSAEGLLPSFEKSLSLGNVRERANFLLKKAQIAFYQHERSKAAEILAEIDEPDLIVSFRKSYLEFQLAYDAWTIEGKGDQAQLLRDIRALYERIRSHQGRIPDSASQALMNQARFTRRLLEYSDPKLLRELHEEVLETEGVVDDDWLLKKIKERGDQTSI